MGGVWEQQLRDVIRVLDADGLGRLSPEETKQVWNDSVGGLWEGWKRAGDEWWVVGELGVDRVWEG